MENNDEKKINQALKVATLYYRDGYNQQDIATELNISRQRFPVYCSMARKRASDHQDQQPAVPLQQLESALVAKYPSKKVIIVPGKDDHWNKWGLLVPITWKRLSMIMIFWDLAGADGLPGSPPH